MGEFLALAASLEHLSTVAGNAKAQVLADALDKATGEFLDNNKSPSRKVGELDNRGSHYYLASYWAKALAEQTADADLAAEFVPVAAALAQQEEAIVSELNNAQGVKGELGGYYSLDDALASTLMRPSATLNAIINK